MTATPPSGHQYVLTHGAYRAVVVEVGGGLRILEAEGRPILQGYDSDAICDGARGQLLLPWPNRIAEASYRFAGTERHLPVTEPSTGCAIHGLTRWANWLCADHQGDRVTLTHRLHPQPGWPGTLDLSATHRLSDDGLAVTITASNIGDVEVPFGAGAHPYLVVGTGRVDDWTLTLGADTFYETDPSGLPTNARTVTGTDFDFRQGRIIGDTVLDTPYTDLHRDRDDRVWAHLLGPDGHAVSIWADNHHRWFQVFTGDHLSDPDRRRTALAIEPMTCPPNAYRSGEDLHVLTPGEDMTLTWGIRSSWANPGERTPGRGHREPD